MKTCRYLIFFLIILLTAGCSDAIDKLIPQEAVNGAVSDIRLDLETQTGKTVKGGKLIRGIAIVPLNIQREQIKPTALSIIKSLKKQNPDIEWFHIFMVNDRRLADCSYWVAIAVYKEGNIEIQGGLPSDAAIAKANALVGKPITGLDGNPIMNDDGTPMLNKGPILRRPTEDDIGLAHSVCKTYKALDREFEKSPEGFNHPWFSMPEREQDKLIAVRLGLEYEQMRETAGIVSRYYLLASMDKL